MNSSAHNSTLLPRDPCEVLRNISNLNISQTQMDRLKYYCGVMNSKEERREMMKLSILLFTILGEMGLYKM